MSMESGATLFEDGSLSDARTEMATAHGAAALHVCVSQSIADIEDIWRALEAKGIESPSQSYDFNKVWAETTDVARQDCAFVGVRLAGEPLMALALSRRRMWGLEVLCALTGRHAGTNTPLMDIGKMMGLEPQARAGLWRRVLSELGGDLVLLSNALSEIAPVFGGSARLVASDTLYRTVFDSWEACDKEQRSRSRRKHDKQQGAKLSALGTVEYERLEAPADVTVALDRMFADRAVRFEEMGIRDPFACPKVRAFYRSVFSQSDTLRGVMHLLRLDGEIVATRYCLVSGEKMFCLISSMNNRPELQPGSPGKQILLHMMQSVFEQGVRVFDLGAGYSDEKRHWCNVAVALSNTYLPRTIKGQLLVHGFVLAAWGKAQVKSNKALFEWLKDMRAKLRGG